MKMSRLESEDITIIKLSQIFERKNPKEEIKKALLQSVYGQVFVVNDNNEFVGSYSIDDFKEDKCIGSLKQIPCIYDDQAHGRLRDQVLKVLADNPYYGIFPLVDDKKQLCGGVTCVDNMWDNDKISNLAYLDYLLEKKIDFGYYFRKKGYKRIAFWGVDKLSLSFSNALRNDKELSVVGIYDNIKRKKYCKENYLNYEVDVNFVDSFEDIINLQMVDLIIITDWTMRAIGNIIVSGTASPVYANTMLKSPEFQRDINTAVFLSWKERLGKLGVECLSVKIPTEHDLHIEPPKAKTMSPKDRVEWFVKENGWDKKKAEVQEFNISRYQLQKRVIKSNGMIYFGDFRSKYINYIDKERITLNQPEEYENVIYLIGPCIVISLFNQDKNTLGFYLQEYLNNNSMKYKVVAAGTSNDADRYYYFNILKEKELKEGDKVFWIDQSNKCSVWDLDMKNVFQQLYKNYGNEFYYDVIAHCGKNGMKSIAATLFEYIKTCPGDLLNESYRKKEAEKELVSTTSKSFAGNPQLEKYKEFIQKEMIHKRQCIGSIVMNCNPFTLGHQYLIEYAAAQVDYLYIFVVEEDKSFFKFEDRIALVKAGTAHIKNVKVLPSGEFIISSNTFSEYFDKANLKGTVIDTSLDVETFATEIAPVLDISIRFVGEEPLDPITNQYNMSMKRILPKYGIEVKEIPRKEFGGKVISASRVRNSLKEKQWEDIQKLVPKTTFEFLIKNFN